MHYEVFEDGTHGLGNPMTEQRYGVYFTCADPAGMHNEQLRVWLYACDEPDLALAAVEGFTANMVLPLGTELHVECATEVDLHALTSANNLGEPLLYADHVSPAKV